MCLPPQTVLDVPFECYDRLHVRVAFSTVQKPQATCIFTIFESKMLNLSSASNMNARGKNAHIFLQRTQRLRPCQDITQCLAKGPANVHVKIIHAMSAQNKLRTINAKFIHAKNAKLIVVQIQAPRTVKLFSMRKGSKTSKSANP